MERCWRLCVVENIMYENDIRRVERVNVVVIKDR